MIVEMWDKEGVPGLAHQHQLREIMPCEERYNFQHYLLGEVIESHPSCVLWLLIKARWVEWESVGCVQRRYAAMEKSSSDVNLSSLPVEIL